MEISDNLFCILSLGMFPRHYEKSLKQANAYWMHDWQNKLKRKHKLSSMLWCLSHSVMWHVWAEKEQRFFLICAKFENTPKDPSFVSFGCLQPRTITNFVSDTWFGECTEWKTTIYIIKGQIWTIISTFWHLSNTRIARVTNMWLFSLFFADCLFK